MKPLSAAARAARGHLLAAVLITAAAVVIAAWIIAAPLREMKAAGQTMTVTGSATREITADYAVWASRVRVRGDALAPAYATVKQARERVLAYFRAAGIADSDIVIAPVTTNPIKKPSPNGYGTTEEIIGYELVQGFEVSSGKVDFLLGLAQRSTSLLEEGLFFEADAPQFFYTDLESLKIELIGAAAENARKRAEMIASRTGSRVGPPRGVRIGVFQVRAAHSTDVSDQGMLDTSSRDKEAMAVVTVNFGIE